MCQSCGRTRPSMKAALAEFWENGEFGIQCDRCLAKDRKVESAGESVVGGGWVKMNRTKKGVAVEASAALQLLEPEMKKMTGKEKLPVHRSRGPKGNVIAYPPSYDFDWWERNKKVADG